MKVFHEMLQKITSSPNHDQMVRFCKPLDEYFGINHFWYYRISNSGDYAYLGSHTAWTEYCFTEGLTGSFSCLRHPNTLQSGIYLMKSDQQADYQKMQEKALEKFQINFSLNLLEKQPSGVEAFGFASRFRDAKADERLLNELPLLRQFCHEFRKTQKSLFKRLDEVQVNLAEHFGDLFYEKSKELGMAHNRQAFLQKIGLGWIYSLTPREVDVMRHMAHGYPASYIAQKLDIRLKTVENYIAILKDKLGCSSKSELISKAKQIELMK